MNTTRQYLLYLMLNYQNSALKQFTHIDECREWIGFYLFIDLGYIVYGTIIHSVETVIEVITVADTAVQELYEYLLLFLSLSFW